MPDISRTKKTLTVSYREKTVGTLAEMENKKIAFSYAPEWIETGFSLNPFSLPLKEGVFIPKKSHFYGLFGVFADSLPDAWGTLLTDRFLAQKGIAHENLSSLDRLSLIGDSGMGALCYHPSQEYSIITEVTDFDRLAQECRELLQSKENPVEDLDTIYKLGGTSGGARPKIMTDLDGKSWIIKFPAHVDRKNIGEMEYDYSICAKACGICMTETKLFPSKLCSGYFGTVRFDRISDRTNEGTDARSPDTKQKAGKSGSIVRNHVLTAAALLETNYEEPALDYPSLMKLTRLLTGECREDIENMYLRMCFNVLAHNRDDHAKNFSYLYDAANNRFRLAPAYDLTYSNTYYGEHTTSVDGNGRNPGEREILKVGTTAGISKKRCQELFEQVKGCVEEKLKKYLRNC